MTVNMIQIIDTMLVNSGELSASAVCSEQEREAFEAMLIQVWRQLAEEEPDPELQPATQKADEAHEEVKSEPSRKAKSKGHKAEADAALHCVTAYTNTIVTTDQPVQAASEQALPLKVRFEARPGREMQNEQEHATPTGDNPARQVTASPKQSAMVETADAVDPADAVYSAALAEPAQAWVMAESVEPAEPVEMGGTRGKAETPKPEPKPDVRAARKAEPGKVQAPQIRSNAKPAHGVHIQAVSIPAIGRHVVNKPSLQPQVAVSRRVTTVAGQHAATPASPALRADAAGRPVTGLGVNANRFMLDELVGKEPGITPSSLHAVAQPDAARVPTARQPGHGPVLTVQQPGHGPVPIASDIGFTDTDREEAAQLPLSIEKPTVLGTVIGKMVVERARVMQVELEHPDHKGMETVQTVNTAETIQAAKTAEAPKTAEPEELVEQEAQPRAAAAAAAAAPMVTQRATTVSSVGMKPSQEQVEETGRAQARGPEKASRQVMQDPPKDRIKPAMRLSIPREQVLQLRRAEEGVKAVDGDKPTLPVSESDASEPVPMASDSDVKAPKPRQPHADSVPYARTKLVARENPVTKPMKMETIDEPRAETARTGKLEPKSEPSQHPQPVAVHSTAEAPVKAEVQRPDALQVSQTNRSELIEQAERAMASAAESGGGTIRVRLHPESLGGLEIRVKVVGKSCTATIKAERPEVGKFIEANSSELAVSLFEKGLDLAGLAVSTWDQARGGWNGWNGPSAGGQEWQWQGHQGQRNEWGSGGSYQGSRQQDASARHGQGWGNGSGRDYPPHERPRTWQAYIDYLA